MARDHDPLSEEESLTDAEDDGRIGIFGSWRAVYISVLVYTVGLILLLYILTRLLDKSPA